MIEIIEVDSLEKKNEKRRSLPKNVRQIGECREKRKIYIEDYVVTYLNKMARPDQAYARGAVLFGNTYETEEGPAIFISGAVEAGNLELDMDEVVFNDHIWFELLDKGEKYFPEQEVIGWFLSRIGFTVEMNQKIINTHMNHFPGEHKVLYMIDSLDKEDAMYLYENNQMIRQKGYYIYYEKNSAMREYMLEKEGGTGQSSEEASLKGEIRRDRKVVNNYRRISKYGKERKKLDVRIRAVRAACAVLIFVMGIYIAEKLGNQFVHMDVGDYVVTTFQAVKGVFMPEAFSVVEETMQGENSQGEKEQNENSQGGKEQNENGQELKGQKENSLGENDQSETAQEENRQGQKEETEEIKETSSYTKPLYYTVKKGDTLAAISRKMYSTDKYTHQIAQANDLTNEDQIYEGQKILIPSIR